MADDIQVSVLMRCLPKRIQQRVQLQLKEDSSYMDVMWPRTGRRRRSSMSLEWFKAMFQQVDLRLWKKMLSHGRARACLKSSFKNNLAKTTTTSKKKSKRLLRARTAATRKDLLHQLRSRDQCYTSSKAQQQSQQLWLRGDAAQRPNVTYRDRGTGLSFQSSAIMLLFP